MRFAHNATMLFLVPETNLEKHFYLFTKHFIAMQSTKVLLKNKHIHNFFSGPLVSLGHCLLFLFHCGLNRNTNGICKTIKSS